MVPVNADYLGNTDFLVSSACVSFSIITLNCLLWIILGLKHEHGHDSAAGEFLLL